MKYTINLVRKKRNEEKRNKKRRAQLLLLGICCFGAFIAACVYAVVEVIAMNDVILKDKKKLQQIEAEYQKYKKTQMVINKEDVELLDLLQNSRIFWTKKMESMALHLPENYWITKFGYTDVNYKVEGYGFISPDQEQLVTLDGYLNELRTDTGFSDVFGNVRLNSAIRSDEQNRMRVSFNYSALNTKAGVK